MISRQPDEPDQDLASLLGVAAATAARSHSPYSGFRVGAAVADAAGRTFAGTNVENSSYGLTICAERSAVFRAVAEGAGSLRGVAIWVEGEQPVAPCGACLQVLAEFAEDPSHFSIHLGCSSGPSRTTTLAELLPAPFRL